MTDQPLFLRPCDERIMQALGQFGFGELGKGARKLRFMGNLATTLPTANATQCTIDRQTLRQLPRGAHVIHRFGHQGPCYGPPILCRPAHTARPGGDHRLDPNHAQQRHELPMFLRQRPQLLLQRREKTPCSTRMNCFSCSETVSFIGRGILPVLESGFETPILKL
jgi:hypothetical protein